MNAILQGMTFLFPAELLKNLCPNATADKACQLMLSEGLRAENRRKNG
jgi:hypothetical protein